MKTFLKIIYNGIFIGLILFISAFYGIYFIGGNEAFKQELVNISNIDTFTSYIVICSIIGIFICELIEYTKFVFVKMRENEKEKDMKKAIKVILGYYFSIILIFVVLALFRRYATIYITENITKIIVINLVIGMVAYGLIVCIISAIEGLLINKKIKEKNKE